MIDRPFIQLKKDFQNILGGYISKNVSIIKKRMKERKSWEIVYWGKNVEKYSQK